MKGSVTVSFVTVCERCGVTTGADSQGVKIHPAVATTPACLNGLKHVLKITAVAVALP